jgi:hypothetical protein
VASSAGADDWTAADVLASALEPAVPAGALDELPGLAGLPGLLEVAGMPGISATPSEPPVAEPLLAGAWAELPLARAGADPSSAGAWDAVPPVAVPAVLGVAVAPDPLPAADGLAGVVLGAVVGVVAGAGAAVGVGSAGVVDAGALARGDGVAGRLGEVAPADGLLLAACRVARTRGCGVALGWLAGCDWVAPCGWALGLAVAGAGLAEVDEASYR